MNKFQRFFNGILGGISSQEKINFARNLSVGIKSGMPLIGILVLLKQQTTSKYFQRIIQGFIDNLNNGQSLAQALSNAKNVFDNFFISIVKVGESSGNLSSSLLYLSQELKKQREIKNKIKSALIYPVIIFCATIGITLFLTIFIFPKLLPVFSSLNIDLPISTKILIALLAFIKSYGLLSLGVLIALLIILKLLLKFKKARFAYDCFLLKLPFISKVIKEITLTSFTRSMHVLLKSGVIIMDALSITRNTFSNLYYKKEINNMIEYVRRGESLAHYLEQNPRFFPSMLTGMIKVGESAGKLEENLEYLSEYYESEVDETLKNLVTIIEPIMLLIMGLMVGFIAISIITPIYKVSQSVFH